MTDFVGPTLDTIRVSRVNWDLAVRVESGQEISKLSRVRSGQVNTSHTFRRSCDPWGVQVKRIPVKILLCRAHAQCRSLLPSYIFAYFYFADRLRPRLPRLLSEPSELFTARLFVCSAVHVFGIAF